MLFLYIETLVHEVNTGYDDELKFYLKFHRHPLNWTIHAVCIPLEWASWLLAVSPLRLHWIIAVGTGLYFLLIRSKVAVIAAISQVVYAYLVSQLLGHLETAYALLLAAIIQAVSWFMQVCVGHYIIERNRPAMGTSLSLNSIVLSTVLAWDC
mmetsp:Transcript_17350/g.29331  ORF Transcript_17350/g.29331 Transcript_17350/m.29331 type:complete len:153 (+) Transcript_17350:154-612(+)